MSIRPIFVTVIGNPKAEQVLTILALLGATTQCFESAEAAKAMSPNAICLYDGVCKRFKAVDPKSKDITIKDWVRSNKHVVVINKFLDDTLEDPKLSLVNRVAKNLYRVFSRQVSEGCTPWGKVRVKRPWRYNTKNNSNKRRGERWTFA